MAVTVYILRCRDGSFYVGSANDLERRIHEHHTGAYGGYTSTRLPIELVWMETFERSADAVAGESKAGVVQRKKR